MQTLSGIRARVLHRTHISLAQLSLSNDATDGKSILNDMISERAAIIQGTASFSWAQAIWTITSTQSVVGQNDPIAYPLPLNFKNELSVVDVLMRAPLLPLEWLDYKNIEPVVRSVDVPRYYMYPPGGRTISFYPDLGSGRTINIAYAKMPFVLYDDQSKPSVPERVSEVYFRCLLEGVVEDVFRYLPNSEQQAQLAGARYAQALSDLKRASKMHGQLVPVLEPQNFAIPYTGPMLPSDYPLAT